MTSLHYITSTDPNNYGTVKYSMTPVVSQPCQVRVSGIQYTASFSITTEDDYIQLEDSSGSTFQIAFPEKGDYFMDTLASDLSTITGLSITMRTDGLLNIAGSYAKISGATHRVKLLMGLYHTDLPLTLPCTSPSIPLSGFGNMLYLVSNLPSPVGVRGNDKNKEEYRSIVYKGSDYIYPNIPVNSRTPGPVIITKTEALTDLEFTLCDFLMEPVILHSPLTITIEVFYGIQAMPMLPVS